MLYPYKVSFVVVVAAVVLLIAKYTVAATDCCTDHQPHQWLVGFDRSVVGIKAGFSLATKSESESESESEWESGVINCVGLNDLVKTLF